MHLNVGDLVYRPYNSHKPGKVVHVYPPGVITSLGRRLYGAVTIRWLDETETLEDMWQLNKFTTLIENHRRRLAVHKAKLPALEAL